jgi:hypothetical protein
VLVCDCTLRCAFFLGFLCLRRTYYLHVHTHTHTHTQEDDFSIDIGEFEKRRYQSMAKKMTDTNE